jgi:hypothetical protein
MLEEEKISLRVGNSRRLSKRKRVHFEELQKSLKIAQNIVEVDGELLGKRLEMNFSLMSSYMITK